MEMGKQGGEEMKMQKTHAPPLPLSGTKRANKSKAKRHPLRLFQSAAPRLFQSVRRYVREEHHGAAACWMWAREEAGTGYGILADNPEMEPMKSIVAYACKAVESGSNSRNRKLGSNGLEQGGTLILVAPDAYETWRVEITSQARLSLYGHAGAKKTRVRNLSSDVTKLCRSDVVLSTFSIIGTAECNAERTVGDAIEKARRAGWISAPSASQKKADRSFLHCIDWERIIIVATPRTLLAKASTKRSRAILALLENRWACCTSSSANIVEGLPRDSLVQGFLEGRGSTGCDTAMHIEVQRSCKRPGHPERQCRAQSCSLELRLLSRPRVIEETCMIDFC